MKKITLICSTVFVMGLAGCATNHKTETGGGLIDPAKSEAPMDCAEGDTRCETGGGLIDPSNDSIEDDCEGDPRCETGGGLIDPAAEQ